MLPKRLRRRLRQIDRERRRPNPTREMSRGPAPQQSTRRARESAAEAEAAGPRPVTPPSGPLEELVPGEVIECDQGSYWLVARPAREMLPHGAEILARFERLIGPPGDEAGDLAARLRGTRPAELALLDTETGGLSAAPVFLVGMIVWESDAADQAVALQMFARDYAEERAVLAEAARLLRDRRVLMTYNGRSFDLPMMRERMIYHGLGECPEPPTHLDLLHETRARFRGVWEDCRLQTLEMHLCGRARLGDIDGADIPDAWHEFVGSGDAGRMAQVLEHNRLDLITMLEVLPHLCDRGTER